MTIGLGLDTGGTYTDAVILDTGTGTIFCKAKALTTHENLSIGLRNAIKKMDPEMLEKVSVVSLSSTLATNSVVEGHGCKVALLCIGFDYDLSIPVDGYVRIDGAHDIHGEETVPLDVDAATRFMNEIKGKVDAVAITGYMSVRNPDHEIKVKELAKKILGVHAVCGYELSSGLGFNERTSTCIMNARLIPVIGELISSLKSVMDEMRIHAPLMIVRGDGTLMDEKSALEKPVETIMSGPAASMMGAMFLTGLKDAIVMDMGGTTTDIGILRDGKPRIDPEGAILGGRRTRVTAAQISTSGIGGDSRVFVADHQIHLSPNRVIPLCVAAERWPAVKERLSAMREMKANHIPASASLNEIILDTEFFWMLKEPARRNDLTDTEMAILHSVRDTPLTIEDISKKLNTPRLLLNVKRLEEQGLLQRIGLTPTDIMHSERTYVQYDAEASDLGVEFLSRLIGTTPEMFREQTKTAIRDKLCLELLKELFFESTGDTRIDTNTMDLAMKAIGHRNGDDFDCSINVRKPIIGIGAPCGVYIRWVGESFNCDVRVDEDSDVGNAVGAITSTVSESVTFLIKPETMGSDDCEYELFSKILNGKYSSLDEATEAARKAGTDYVCDALSLDGVTDRVVTCDHRDKKFEYGDTCTTALMERELVVTAAGKPKPFEH